MKITLDHLLGADVVVPQHLHGVGITGISADSRKIKPGQVFFALSGSTVDGTKYVDSALKNGAVAVVAKTGTDHKSTMMLQTDNPHRVLARAAARFFGQQPETIVAVTGTNGKTSVAVFVRQIWEAMGFRAASLGTIGVVGPTGTSYLQHTTPDPMQLHKVVAALSEDHVKHLVVEASSHGLSQYRMDGLNLTAGAFTNLSHDHLDYHATVEDYFNAKMRLFEELLPVGSAAVINMDADRSNEVLRRCETRGLQIIRVGRKGVELKLLDVQTEGLEQHLRIQTPDGIQAITLPLAGEFQVSNALVAAGLVVAAGGERHHALHALQSVRGAPGRLEYVGRSKSGASAFVDYAHTPDALENALTSLRPFATGKLVVVFGCGGDRDKSKRPIMGAIATRLADHVIVTDDNPRTEDAATIRRQILAGTRDAREIGSRAEAIAAAVAGLSEGDILLVAGKGHETGQIVGAKVHPFSDHDAVAATLSGVAYVV